MVMYFTSYGSCKMMKSERCFDSLIPNFKLNNHLGDSLEHDCTKQLFLFRISDTSFWAMGTSFLCIVFLVVYRHITQHVWGGGGCITRKSGALQKNLYP